MAIVRMTQRRVAGAGLAVVLAYALWIGWPYLESIVVRDAAVTSWISVTAAPISGYTTNPLYPGARVGSDGRIATITDERADQRDLAKTRAEQTRALANVAAQEAVVDGLKRLLVKREQHAAGFAATFGQDLDAAIVGAKASLESLRERNQLAHAEVQRLTKLQSSGHSSPAMLEKAQSIQAALQQEISSTEASIARAAKRQRAAASGVFLLEDGADGNSAFQNLVDARTRLSQAEAALTQYRAERDAAQAVLEATQRAYDRSRALDIVVPHNAMVWSLISGPGAPVQAGAPVASWVDCSVMLVDVPLSDVEIALLHPGAAAEVVLEGERKARRGSVLLTRGSAGTLGAHDLAAISRARRPGLGQAIVRLEPSAADIRACPIGHAAYVDFPGVGLLQILRARLRL